MNVQSNQELDEAISYVMRDICELPDRTSPEDRPTAMVVEPRELREILRNHIGELLAKQPFNKLTPAEVERLALLTEEMGGAAQAVGKILRHGYESAHPNGGPTNRKMLERELGDVRHSILRMCLASDVSDGEIDHRSEDKYISVLPYLHHQND